MIQDIEPYTLDNSFAKKQPQDGAYAVVIRKNAMLLGTGAQGIDMPRVCELPLERESYTYLFSVSGQEFYLADESTECAALPNPAEGYGFCAISAVRRRGPKWLGFAAVTAFQLGSWYKNNRYCGRCGAELHPHAQERALVCDNCKNLIYPKICPAVIVCVTDGDRVLLTKYSDQHGGSGHYALIAGFTEVGETVEQTVTREVMEEVGLRVKNLRYYKSQPWSFSDTLLMGFFCEVDGSKKITMDKNELSTAEWVARGDMQTKDDGVSLTYEMMELFKTGGEYTYNDILPLSKNMRQAGIL